MSGGAHSDCGMADELAMMTADVMATPEQVLAAGGVSKRRRGASSSKRRSPSGQRRRPATPEPAKNLPGDPEEKPEVKPEVSSTVRRISTTEKALIMKRSLSSPGEGRLSLRVKRNNHQSLQSRQNKRIPFPTCRQVNPHPLRGKVQQRRRWSPKGAIRPLEMTVRVCH